jgi:DNA-binding transcriptional MerR regulator
MEKTSLDSKTTIDFLALELRSQASAAPNPQITPEGDSHTQVEFALDGFSIRENETRQSPLQSFHSADTNDEIEMIGALCAEPRVEPSIGLLREIDAIPQKMAFKIGEAAEMVGVKQYVLRYWESEFDSLRPKKSKNNQRVYSRRDVETAMMIKKLLYEDRFSIEGARSALRQLKSQVKEEKGLSALARSRESALARVESQVRALLADIRRSRDVLT